MQRLEGDVNLDEMGPLGRLIHVLATAAKQGRLRRMGDRVLRPHPTIRGVFVHHQLSLDFINAALLDDPVYSTGVFVKKLDEWFAEQDHPLFPIIRPADVDRAAIAFRDGWFDVETCQWFPMDDAERLALVRQAAGDPDADFGLLALAGIVGAME